MSQFSPPRETSSPPSSSVGQDQSFFDPSSGFHKCKQCPKEFKELKHFQCHYRSTHLKIKFKCPICQKELSRRDHLARHHQNVHVGSEKFKCDNCDKVFTRKDHLARHQRRSCTSRVGPPVPTSSSSMSGSSKKKKKSDGKMNPSTTEPANIRGVGNALGSEVSRSVPPAISEHFDRQREISYAAHPGMNSSTHTPMYQQFI